MGSDHAKSLAIFARQLPASSRVITKSFQALTGRQDITVGMVACVQTFGNFANFHPHLHIPVTDGGFGPNGRYIIQLLYDSLNDLGAGRRAYRR